MSVLVVNTGGVTLRCTTVGDDHRLIDDQLVDPWDGHDTAAIARFVGNDATIDAVGHRVVHGGRYQEPVIIDDEVLDALEDASSLAPVHQQRALLGIRATRSLLPDVPHVACFDTTFHQTIPDAAATYAVPAEWRRRWPLRRVGFHGLSHQHVAKTAGAVLPDGRSTRRIVSCHLGSGASVCAILDGTSVDTTMGMTPLEGLVMVHRSGSVDPGLLLWLLQHTHLSIDEVSDGLHDHGGLTALAGGSGDMRDVVERRAHGDDDATLAFDVYTHRLRREIGAMAASLDGIDVLAFTGGVAEHMPVVRAATVDGLTHLDVDIDPERNREAMTDADITRNSASVACVVVAGGEHLTIADGTRTTIDRCNGPDGPKDERRM